jgi:aminopeptidase N
MRYLHSFLYSICTLLLIGIGLYPTSARAQLAGPEIHKANRMSMPSYLGQYPDKDDNYDVAFYGLDIEVFPDTKSISGSTRIRSRIRQATDTLELDLVSNLTIDSVVAANGQHLTIDRFNRTPDWLFTVHLPREYQPDEITDFTVYYHGKPRSGGFGSFTFTEQGGSPAIWTLSEPFGAKDWFAVKDTPADKADSAWVFITVPDPLVAASNGLLTQTVDLPNDRTRYEWKTRYPIAQYLISMAIGNYEYFEDTYTADDGTQMPVVDYIYANTNVSSIRNQTAITRRLLDIYSDYYGPYPFIEEKYGHAQFGWGGGMEHQTLSSMGVYRMSIVGHELAHQWFGDAVTCETWQDIWLNEGFASFSEGLAVEALEGKEAYYEWLQDVYQQVAVTNDGQVYVPGSSVDPGSVNSVDRIFNYRLTYLKGAATVHMLRYVMGDELFFEALRDYVGSKHAYGTATTADFQAVLEEYYKQKTEFDDLPAQYSESLQWFFNQWIYGEGYPNYSLKYSILAQRDSARVRIQLTDTPSHPSVDHYTMPVPVQLVRKDDQGEIVQDTTLRLMHLDPSQEWTLSVPFIPTEVVFDPNADLLRGFEETEKLDIDVWGGERPHKIELLNNYPNPFNPSTTIPYQLPQETYIRIDVYNLYGQHIAKLLEGRKSAGEHVVHWNAQQLASGIYYIRLSDGRQNHTKKVTLIK